MIVYNSMEVLDGTVSGQKFVDDGVLGGSLTGTCLWSGLSHPLYLSLTTKEYIDRLTLFRFGGAS
jgi:hypothetical protein